MARKILTVQIKTAGRDCGKVFVITEMSAWDAENWATEAIFAMMNAGVVITEDIAEAGLAGLAALGISALTKISYEKAKPLLDRMMSCVQIQLAVVRPIIDDDIEEVSTLLQLRKEVFNLHLSFFTQGGKLTSDPAGEKVIPA